MNEMDAPLYYELKKPSNLNPDKKYPVLFMLHGMGSNEKDLPPLVEGFENEMFIFSLRGPIIQPPGYAFFTFQNFGSPDRDTFDHALRTLEAFITYAEQHYPIDAENIFLMGFSQGSIVSMSFAIQNFGRIKGVIALSGYIPTFVKEENKTKNLEKLNIFVSHGMQDPVLPYAFALESKNFLEKTKANFSFKSYQAGHFVTEENYNDLRTWLKEQLNTE
jgi:phospholipase/carboxylesterase